MIAESPPFRRCSSSSREQAIDFCAIGYTESLGAPSLRAIIASTYHRRLARKTRCLLAQVNTRLWITMPLGFSSYDASTDNCEV